MRTAIPISRVIAGSYILVASLGSGLSHDADAGRSGNNNVENLSITINPALSVRAVRLEGQAVASLSRAGEFAAARLVGMTGPFQSGFEGGEDGVSPRERERRPLT
jgi:hypothetical protein